ncbi:MAG: DUF4350 domain-containing protein [Pyrinomonadaceae bacterium]
MRQKLGIILTFIVVIGLLVAINATTYVSEDEQSDSEMSPNRSTYYAGATGTRALYDLLSESGYKVMRWREIPEKLLTDSGQNVKTFVIIGEAPVPIDDDQAKSILFWVEQGGALVLVDRTPATNLLPSAGAWRVRALTGAMPTFDVEPSNREDMTAKGPVVPAQPTLLTQSVESVMPSRFASTFHIFNPEKEKDSDSLAQWPELGTDEDTEDENAEEPSPASPAPVVHLSDSRGPLLLDYRHGLGRIALLSDPYIYSNGGIGLHDNLQLAINMLAGREGLIAFDEYHQGRGVTRKALIGYFSGTPVLALLGQFALLVLVIIWTRSRRFARPLPLTQIDRRSTLEFVASMAELQQRSRAYDLAIENIYSRTRRVLARYAGVEYNSPRAEIASRVAARSSLEAHSLEVLMRQCEEAINGAPVNERQTIQLVKRLRDVERTLGLRMRARDLRQAARNV